MTPMITVVIPTCDRDDRLRLCLSCLAPGMQTLPFDKYEVIVADDGTTRTVEAMIRQDYPWVKWVCGPKKGPAANRNAGARHASGIWLAFTDDDCLPEQAWLQAYHEAIMVHDGVRVFEGRTYAERPRISFDDFAPINEKGGMRPSCNFMIHQSAFDSINGFDESFAFSFEDVDFFYRLTEANEAIDFVASAGVCHPWRRPPKGKWWRDIRREKVGLSRFIAKHPKVIGKINSIHYVKVFLSGLLSMVQEIKRYRGAGLPGEVRERLYELELVFALLPRTIGYMIRAKRI